MLIKRKQVLDKREKLLDKRERNVSKLQKKYETIINQEDMLNQKINEFNKITENFYTNEIEKLIIKHLKEMKEVEDLLIEQFEIINKLQSELNLIKSQLKISYLQKDDIESFKFENRLMSEEIKNETNQFNLEKEQFETQLSNETVRVLSFY